MITVIYGPQGSGKTIHAESLRKHFGKTKVHDEWAGETGSILSEDTLYLTLLDLADLRAWNGGLLFVAPYAQVLSIDEALLQLATELPAAETGAKREKLNAIPYDLIPYQELTDAYVRVAEHGAVKYEPWNWSKGLPRVQLLGSLLRHTFAYLRGKDYDDGPKGSGLLHTDHILWNAVALVHNVHWNLEDGRRKEPPREYTR